jgi:hypothetical protein
MGRKASKEQGVGEAEDGPSTQEIKAKRREQTQWTKKKANATGEWQQRTKDDMKRDENGRGKESAKSNVNARRKNKRKVEEE